MEQEKSPGYDRKLLTILRVAATVFAHRGYDRASIRDIAAVTEVSLSGLYHYFRSKEELLFLVQHHCLDTLLDGLALGLRGVTDPELRLRLLVRNHVRFFVHNPREMKVLVHEADRLTGEFRDRIEKRRRYYIDTLLDILSDLRPVEGPNPRVAAFALLGTMNWLHAWCRDEDAVPADTLEDELVHLFLHGFLSSRPELPDPPVELPEDRGVAPPTMWQPTMWQPR